MEYSEITTSKDDGAAPDSGRNMGRALLSAAVFGTIGAFFGKWLGAHGNSKEGQMAKPMMTWGMGGFWALLAAYSSLKKDDPASLEHKPTTRKREVGLPIRDYAEVGDTIEAQANTVPTVHVQQATAQAHGLVHEFMPQLAAQK